ncbi:CD226 antigen-like isoform X1 [Colossoma macropomum]|uniref:CD226 antigen-like isoform X1 n=1 Tax=Colossoma macropomum TaxID=42526 RepID=UPI00186562DE|nr:CD226 antigen-like isoform X1 [Colossoma macropomum]
MSAMALLLCSIGVLSVCLSSQAGLTVEAEPGDDVTLWCQYSLSLSSYLFWFKQTNNSAPVFIACRYYTVSSSSSNSCFFITESNRSVMRVNSMNSSLTITAVNHSDSGLYYCSTQREQFMTFSNTTYLQIRERYNMSFTNADKSTEAVCTSNVVPMLVLVFGAVIVVLLSVLLFLLFNTLKYRKQHREDSDSKLKQENEEQDGEMMNYVALNFSNKKNRRSHR